MIWAATTLERSPGPRRGCLPGLPPQLFGCLHRQREICRRPILRCREFELGATVQGENIYDRYKEFQRIDSAGYSLPHRESQLDSVVLMADCTALPWIGLDLYTHVSATQLITNTRLKGYVNWEGKWATDKGIWTYNAGVRTQYATLNGELRISPRFKLFYKPNERRAAPLPLPPDCTTNTRSTGKCVKRTACSIPRCKAKTPCTSPCVSDKDFEMWGRPFVWSFESYYKGPQPRESVRYRKRTHSLCGDNNAIGTYLRLRQPRKWRICARHRQLVHLQLV
jgi:hypothetical protein